MIIWFLLWWRRHLKKKSREFLIYRDYKKFALTNFKSQLLSKLNHRILNYPSFENKFVNVLKKHSPKKVFLWSLKASFKPHKTRILFWWDVFFPYKHFDPLCKDVFVNSKHIQVNIFKDCRKTLGEKRNNNRSQVNDQ